MNISSPKNLEDTIYITDQSFDSLENNKKRLKSTKHDFEYQVNIHGYNPDEIKFNIEENDIVIHAKHIEQRDKEQFYCQFERRIQILENIDKDSISWNNNHKGYLEIIGSKKKHHLSSDHHVSFKNKEAENNELKDITHGEVQKIKITPHKKESRQVKFRQRSKSVDAKHLTELMEAPNFVLNNSKAMKLSQKITGNPKHKQKRCSLGNSMEQEYEQKESDQDPKNEENKNQGQNQYTEKDHPNVYEQKSTNSSALADVQKYKYKQEEPHYMKSIPCIYEHEHEQRHHNYKEGSPVQPYNQNHTNEINTFSRIPFGLEK